LYFVIELKYILKVIDPTLGLVDVDALFVLNKTDVTCSVVVKTFLGLETETETWTK